MQLSPLDCFFKLDLYPGDMPLYDVEIGSKIIFIQDGLVVECLNEHPRKVIPLSSKRPTQDQALCMLRMAASGKFPVSLEQASEIFRKEDIDLKLYGIVLDGDISFAVAEPEFLGNSISGPGGFGLMMFNTNAVIPILRSG